MTLPWFIAITISSGGDFWRLSLGEDFFAKVQSGQEKHGAPPGFYFILFWWTFWPAALFATGGAAIWLWRNRRLPRALFLLAWIVPFWIAIELTPTKLPHYALPFYPAIAIAAAWILRRKAFGPELPARTYKQAAVLFAAIAGLHIAAIAGFAWLFEVEAGAILPAALLLIAAFAAAGAVAAWRKRVNVASAAAVLTAAVFYATAFQVALPRLDPVWISRSADSAIASLAACGHGPVAFSGYSEPSAVFKLGTPTILTNPEQAGADLASGKAGFAMIGLRQGASFEDAYRKAAGVDPYRLGCVDGFNLNRGQPIRLTIYASAQAQAVAACAPPPRFQCRPKEDVRWRRVLDTDF
jgi:4-amino-4-deoxy-L-arabinose transferase-like glycosyltransferase